MSGPKKARSDPKDRSGGDIERPGVFMDRQSPVCNARAETTEKEAVRLREDFRYEGMNEWMNGGLLSRSVVKRVREIEKVIGYGFGGDRWKEGTKEQKKKSSRSSREREPEELTDMMRCIANT